jgi:penicillin-binding protein 1C
VKPIGVAALGLALMLALPAQALPSFGEVRAAHRPSDVPVLDRHGVPLQMVRVDSTVRRGPWVALQDLSPALREAIVLGEDRRFWEHAGVDWAALVGSAWANAWNMRSRGASTLTMQLAGLIDASAARPAGGRGTAQKLSQIALARELETRWRKTEILEAYLNQVPLRGEMVGVPAAAQGLFGKHPSGLDGLESAVLAVLVRAPNAGQAEVSRRACALLALQRRDCAGLDGLLAQAFARRPGAWPGEALAPHFARMWAAESPGPGPRRSTLDASVQRLAVAALRRQLAELRGREVEDGAVVVLDNRSGEVLAWVGSSGPGSSAGEVDAVLARRQPGSTLKPFIYALAFERGLIGPDSLLLDAPLQLRTGDGVYQPQNYDLAYKGWVPARVALAASLNVPAIRLTQALEVEQLFGRLNDLGLRLRESAGFHGVALALGSADVTLLDLTNAYRSLARRGEWTPVRWQTGVGAPRARRVFNEAAAIWIAEVLADGTARAPTFGFDSPLVTREAVAVKTGTSKDMRDNWCVGFTARHTVGVWVGNAGGAPMRGVSGVTGAAPVWREVVEALSVRSSDRAPGDVSHSNHARHAGIAPGPGLSAFQPALAFSIQSPAAGSIWLMDPSLSEAVQRILLYGPAGQWWLDGRRIADGSRAWWSPRPGRHVLELRDAGGRLLDRVDFEVRQVRTPRA